MKTWFVIWSGRRSPIRRGGRKLPRGKGYFYVLAKRRKFVVDFRTGVGMWVRWVGPRDHSFSFTETDVGHHFERPDMKKKASVAAMGDSKHLAPLESRYFHDLLALVEHCAVRKYDDGDSREPGWVNIKTQGAAWIVQVKDPDSCCSFSAVGETLDKALESAVLLLGCEEAPWEPDAYLSAAKARKKK